MTQCVGNSIQSLLATKFPYLVDKDPKYLLSNLRGLVRNKNLFPIERVQAANLLLLDSLLQYIHLNDGKEIFEALLKIFD